MAQSQGKLKSSLPLTAVLFPVARHHQQGLAEAVQQRGQVARSINTCRVATQDSTQTGQLTWL